jgi:hypothetical protein
LTALPEPQFIAGARVLGVVTDYNTLIETMRTVATQRRLALSSDTLANVAGIPDRYLTKVLGPKQSKRLGPVSMGPVLSVLGLKLVAVEDAEAIARLEGRLEYISEGQERVRSFVVKRTISTAFMKKIGRISAQKRASLRLKDAERSEVDPVFGTRG